MSTPQTQPRRVWELTCEWAKCKNINKQHKQDLKEHAFVALLCCASGACSLLCPGAGTLCEVAGTEPVLALYQLDLLMLGGSVVYAALTHTHTHVLRR